MTPIIDICSDLGEGYGNYSMANDEKMLEIVTSANIACGFHAGDPRTMQKTVKAAISCGTGIGAHPSFPDRVGFGRRNMELSYEEIYTDLIYQLGAIYAFAKANNADLQHVLPHGQLGNMATDNQMYASALADAIFDFDPSLIVMTQPGFLHLEAKKRGLTIAIPIFADRAYNDDQTLVSRNIPGAVITDPDIIVKRSLQMVFEQKVTAITGQEIEISGHTLLVHGDTKNSLDIASEIRTALLQHGAEILPLGKWLQQ